MKTKFATLALASSLLSACAFAGEEAKEIVTIQVAGKIIATVLMDDQPKGAQFTITSESKNPLVYDQEKKTVAGNFTFAVTKDDKILLQIYVNDGVAILPAEKPQNATTPPAAVDSIGGFVLQTPRERPDNFCGQSEVTAMLMKTDVWQQMQRENLQQAARQPIAQAAVQPQPAPQK